MTSLPNRPPHLATSHASNTSTISPISQSPWRRRSEDLAPPWARESCQSCLSRRTSADRTAATEPSRRRGEFDIRRRILRPGICDVGSRSIVEVPAPAIRRRSTSGALDRDTDQLDEALDDCAAPPGSMPHRGSTLAERRGWDRAPKRKARQTHGASRLAQVQHPDQYEGRSRFSVPVALRRIVGDSLLDRHLIRRRDRRHGRRNARDLETVIPWNLSSNGNSRSGHPSRWLSRRPRNRKASDRQLSLPSVPRHLLGARYRQGAAETAGGVPCERPVWRDHRRLVDQRQDATACEAPDAHRPAPVGDRQV